MSSVKVAKHLENAVKKSGLSITEISKNARVSRQTLYRVLRADIREIKLSTMLGVCKALQVDPVEVLRIYSGRNPV